MMTTFVAEPPMPPPVAMLAGAADAAFDPLTSFVEYVFAWNRLQALSMPGLHLRISRWLGDRFLQRDRHLLLSIFRDAGKSTLIGLFCAWLLLRNPDTRILVLAADHQLACKMTRSVRRLLERHPASRHLVPRRPEQWAADRFTVKRDLSQRDPSLLARGISSNITGSRADVVICDDVEVPNTADTAQKRDELRVRLSEVEFVLVPDGTQIFVGTPHTFHSIYNKEPVGEEAPLLQGFDRLFQPIIDPEGISVWPSRFAQPQVEAIRGRAGPARFKSQMLLVPTRASEARLDPDLLVAYDDEVETLEGNGELILRIGGRRMVSASCWWDPAFGRPGRGDASVVAVVFVDHEGDYWLHALRYITIADAAAAAEDRATLQCKAVASIVGANAQPAVTIETNGIGKFLPGLLRTVLKDTGLTTTVLEHVSSSSKDRRILDVLDPVLAARRLHAHGSIWSTPFIEEMREWIPGRNGRDDGLDAVSGAIMRQPVRLRSVRAPTARPTWRLREATVRAGRFDI